MMKTKKILALIISIMLIVTLFTGCGSSSSTAYRSDYAGEAISGYPSKSNSISSGAQGFSSGSYSSSEYEDYTKEYYEESETPRSTSFQNTKNIPDNIKIVYTADIAMESLEFDDAYSALTKLTDECGGWYQSSSVDNSQTNYRRGYYTIRVPAENFYTFCESIGESAKVTKLNANSDDISDNYYDKESRLAAKQVTLDRYMSLLERATEMSDIIELNRAIENLELEIEQLTGSLRKYDSLVAYATIQVTLTEVYKFTPVEEPVIGFWAKLGEAFKSGTESLVEGLEDFAIGFARHWFGWLIFIIIVAVIILIIVRKHKKKVKLLKEQGMDFKLYRKAKHNKQPNYGPGPMPVNYGPGPMPMRPPMNYQEPPVNPPITEDKNIKTEEKPVEAEDNKE